MNLQNLAKEIKEKTLIANDDLKDATNNTRPMREGTKRAAQSTLNDLKQQYRLLLVRKAAYIVASGPNAEELEKTITASVPVISAEELTKEQDLTKVILPLSAFIVNPDELYQDVFSRIDERAYMNRNVDGTFFLALNDALENVSLKIGIQSYPQLLFKSEYSQVLTSKEQAAALVKKIINTDVGGELVGIYAINKILDESIDRISEDSFSPIVLTSKDTSTAVNLSNDLRRLSNNVFLVSVGKKIPKVLKSALNSITIEEANVESVNELLQGIRSRTV